jgi:hypothetical protein
MNYLLPSQLLEVLILLSICFAAFLDEVVEKAIETPKLTDMAQRI